MAGKKATYAGGTNMSSLKYFGIPIVSIGLANPKEDPTLEVLVNNDPEHNIYKKAGSQKQRNRRHDACKLALNGQAYCSI